ncbi:hypothetical protein [Actinorugispora endophytica]|uniref:DUF4352 domain-containing protein n=1 Tax=Actinorugispora endophytica TaxID=1605990 RepID=A0A4R6VEG6_9ACTN|nr:hypothetical protein [Actinorugispora endophytica]TDQ55437.1 hypothetical protein EV190_101764 [Actinorugispora endophytica]
MPPTDPRPFRYRVTPPPQAPPPRPEPPEAPEPRPAVPRRAPWWRRRHLPSALALLVLLPLGVGVPWWLEREDLLAEGVMAPEAVPVPGTTGSLSGSEWEFRGMVLGETGGFGEPLPDGVELVDAVFLVTPGDASASELLLASCEFLAVDGRGRTWTQTSAYAGRVMPEEVGSTSFGCAGPDAEAIAPGSEQGLVATFLVPEDAVDSLRFEVRADTSDDPEAPRPAAVSFRADSA